MTALLKVSSILAMVLGFLLALPGLLLLIAASQIATLLVTRAQAQRDHALDMEVR